jgi:hypothetical protein
MHLNRAVVWALMFATSLLMWALLVVTVTAVT